MARRHVAVALLVPPPAADEIDVLRRGLGAPDLEVVAPHLTLVPPCSLRERDLHDALALLRGAAAVTAPLALQLGPVTTFSPVTPTVHLAVGAGPAPGDDPVELAGLHAAVRVGPFGRPALHPFVPHVTLLEQAPLHRIRAACLALDAVRLPVTFGRLTLLAERRDGVSGRRCWRPLADVDLGGVRLRGRGGLPIELARGSLLDPEATAALQLPTYPGAGHRVVIARLGDEVVGAAWGPSAEERRVRGPLAPDVLTAAWLDDQGRGWSLASR